MVIDQALEAAATQLTTLERPCHKCVEPMSEKDVPAAAEMAVRLLPASLLAQLGRSFLAALYRAALDHPSTIALKVSARDFYTAMGFQFEQERRVLGQPMTYLMRKF